MVDYLLYPDYKSSGVDWLGDIPSHWDVVRIKHLTPVKRGASPRPIDDPKYFDDEGEFAWVRIADVSASERYLERTTQRLSEIGDKLSVSRFPGDLFLSIAGTVGKPIITKIKCCIHDGFVYFPDFMGNKEFLYYVFACGRPYLGLGKMGTQLNLNTDTVGSILIGFPPVTEQEAIVNFLDFKTAQIDALIAKKQALLEKLAEKRTALISHAVTKGLDPSVPMKDSGVEWLGEIPAHWEAKRLKFFVSIFGGGTPNTSKPEYWHGEIPWVSPKDMKSDFIDSTEDYLTDLGVTESATKIVPVNSVLIVVRSGILRHTIPVARNTIDVALNQDMKALVTNQSMRPGFLHWCINGLQKGLLPLWSKQGCTVESIEMGYMTNTFFPLPPIDEQDAILEHVSKITTLVDLQIQKVRNVILALAEYRSALITNAVTGKIDVRQWQVPQEVA